MSHYPRKMSEVLDTTQIRRGDLGLCLQMCLLRAKGFSAIIRRVLWYRVSSVVTVLPCLALSEDAGLQRSRLLTFEGHLPVPPTGIIQME